MKRRKYLMPNDMCRAVIVLQTALAIGSYMPDDRSPITGKYDDNTKEALRRYIGMLRGQGLDISFDEVVDKELMKTMPKYLNIDLLRLPAHFWHEAD